MTSRGLNEFCTLFDRNYLVRGLALYRSLERNCGEFRLRVVCLDQETEDCLRRLSADHLEIISLTELEAHDPELLAKKNGRSRVEYYWTSTPCMCSFLLDREPHLEAITYLDADLMFFSSPAPLFDELGGGSVLLVPHRWAPEHWCCESTDGTSEEAWGVYNVEFMTFRRDRDGRAALAWWRERCLEFCPALIHPGAFGDQKYLDDWPERFRGVHVLRHLGGGLAPWNVSQYQLERHGGEVLVDGQRLVFHHYQGLWLHEDSFLSRLLAKAPSRYRRCPSQPSWIWASRWPLSQDVLDLIWEPYIQRLSEAAMELVEAGTSAGLGSERASAGLVSSRFVKGHLPKRLRRTYWRVRRARRASTPRGSLAISRSE